MKPVSQTKEDLRSLGRRRVETARTQLLEGARVTPVIELMGASDGSVDVTITFDASVVNSPGAKKELKRKVRGFIDSHGFSRAVCVADSSILDGPEHDADVVVALTRAGYSLPDIQEIFRVRRPYDQVVVAAQRANEKLVFRLGYHREPDGTVLGFETVVTTPAVGMVGGFVFFD